MKHYNRILYTLAISFIPALIATHANAQVITTVAGCDTIQSYTGDGGAATSAGISFPSSVAADASGNLFIADYGHNVIRKVDASGIISTFAGSDSAGYSGDGGPASSALLNEPQSVAVDTHGNVYICDWNNHVVRKVNTAGIISTFAGNDTSGNSGDGGLATAAEIGSPSCIAFDASGNVYIVDFLYNTIRKVDTSGIISTFVAGLNRPCGIAIDTAGNVYFSDNSRVIRKIKAVGGAMSIFAGSTPGCSGDGVAATSAQLAQPLGLAFDAAGNLYVADANLSCTVVRKINTDGIISTVAGNGIAGYHGDGGPATSAELAAPEAVALDPAGNLYIADNYNNVIRKVTNSVATSVKQTNATGHNLALFPNPNNGTFDLKGTINGATGENILLEVTDMLGRVMEQHTITIQEGIVNTELKTGLANGVYLLHIVSATGTATLHFVINK